MGDVAEARPSRGAAKLRLQRVVLALFPQRALPTTYVIRRSGAVVQKFVGSITTEARLAELLSAIEAGLQ